MNKILFFLSISLLFLGCDDETQPSGGGQARIIINCPIPNEALGESFGANSIGGILTTPGSTDLFSVTKGQNVLVSLSYVTSLGSCKNVEVKFELNGSIIETRNYNLGGTDMITCADGNSKSINFIVP